MPTIQIIGPSLIVSQFMLNKSNSTKPVSLTRVIDVHVVQFCVRSWYKSGVVNFVSLKTVIYIFPFGFFVFMQRTVFSDLCYCMVELG